MGATSRAFAALTLSVAAILPAVPAAGLPGEDPAPAPVSSASSSAPAPAVEAVAVVKPREGATAVPDIATRGWVLADLDSGEILAMANSDLPLRPASTQKLLMALTVAPRLAPDQPYRAVKADETAEGNRVVLYGGLHYTVADLMHAALLPSANDAADALARANGGIATTVEQMNAEAARLGVRHTTVRNPSGLDADGQLTTPYDLALIGRAAFANPEIASYLALQEVDFPGKRTTGDKRFIYPIYTHNRMLLHNYEGALGGKSGYTSHAGNTFVGAAERDGHRLMVSLMHIGGNTYTTAERLLDWGFANADKLDPVGQLAEPSAPAPQFDRAVQPLPPKGRTPEPRTFGEASATDAPTATNPPGAWGLPTLPVPSIPSPLTLLTLLVAVVVALRARVYWVSHRSRTSWTTLEEWAQGQAGSAGRTGPADRRVGRTTRAAVAVTNDPQTAESIH